MPLFLVPIILGAAAVAAAGVGIKKGADGFSNMKSAKEIGETAQQKYNEAINLLEKERNIVNDDAENLFKMRVSIRNTTFIDFTDMLKKLKKKAGVGIWKDVPGGIESQIRDFVQYDSYTYDTSSIATGGVESVLAGAGASAGASTAATSIGVASTGTAIGTLHGAAATNAFLAWLGGGSLAIGGGGMALGTIILGGIVTAPAALIGGFVFAGEGEKALTKAFEYDALVIEEIAKLDTVKARLKRITKRIQELGSLIENFNEMLCNQIKYIDLIKFSRRNYNDLTRMKNCLQLAAALRELIDVPIMDEMGNPTDESYTLIQKYASIL